MQIVKTIFRFAGGVIGFFFSFSDGSEKEVSEKEYFEQRGKFKNKNPK